MTIPVVVGGIINAVQAAKDAGAHRVLVGNIADLGKTPAFLQLGPNVSAAATAVSALTNASLHQALLGISGIQIIEFSLFDFVQDLTANPAALGLTNVTAPCYTGFVLPDPNATECLNPQDFLFWDVVHPTTQVHEAIARSILIALPEPSALALMVFPLVALVVSRRRKTSA